MSDITERKAPGIGSLSMVEVYQVAADIGKDLESLIERFGGDDFRDLMPRIIKTLEYLENAVKKVETQNGNIRSLEERIAKVQQELDSRVKENSRLIQELEEAADKKSEDDVFWMKQLTELQKENAFLKDQVSEKDVIAVKERVQEQEAVKVLMVMKQTVDKQRHQLRTLDAEIRQKTDDIEALQEQIERLVKLNQDLHQKNELIQAHAQGVIREKSHLMSEMKAMEKDRPLQHSVNYGPETNSGETQTQDGAPSTNGMILIDPKDPERPRFTFNELYSVLQERDELKFQLFLLNEDMKSAEHATEETAASSPHKSESSISRFFKSFFRSHKKKSPAIIKDGDSSSSEGNWELLDREDALPTVGYVVGDVKDAEKALIKLFEKYQQPPKDQMELSDLTTGRHSEGAVKPFTDGDGENGDGQSGKVVKGTCRTGEPPVHEGTDVDRRDINYNVNNNQSDGQDEGTEGGDRGGNSETVTMNGEFSQETATGPVEHSSDHTGADVGSKRSYEEDQL